MPAVWTGIGSGRRRTEGGRPGICVDYEACRAEYRRDRAIGEQDFDADVFQNRRSTAANARPSGTNDDAARSTKEVFVLRFPRTW